MSDFVLRLLRGEPVARGRDELASLVAAFRQDRRRHRPPPRRQGYLDADSSMLFIGPEAEARFGRRHFMDMLAVFTAPPQFTVLSGRTEIGRTDAALLAAKVQGPRLLLGGRSWRVTLHRLEAPPLLC
ncbi:hypothetical protein ACNAW0_07370 [Micromonospora sp. SL1-18]|uniref:hypothetical protein n=1 Tax=Micromonospora sp. SL1-18 TaxID=3399128 RepID=UPI003A4D705F